MPRLKAAVQTRKETSLESLRDALRHSGRLIRPRLGCPGYGAVRVALRHWRPDFDEVGEKERGAAALTAAAQLGLAPIFWHAACCRSLRAAYALRRLVVWRSAVAARVGGLGQCGAARKLKHRHRIDQLVFVSRCSARALLSVNAIPQIRLRSRLFAHARQRVVCAQITKHCAAPPRGALLRGAAPSARRLPACVGAQGALLIAGPARLPHVSALASRARALAARLCARIARDARL
mmetsp:Transcript_15768/g.47357  ORF Transcript_15768/g.47357 Transcript_15768/m.47357 type:complete len:236 (+) Transcript_15768:3-710(+)